MLLNKRNYLCGMANTKYKKGGMKWQLTPYEVGFVCSLPTNFSYAVLV